MRRGVQQSLYKYLPGSWIDFSSKEDDGRENYIAHVDFWNSVRLEGINHRRLLRIIDRTVKSFGRTSGFPTDINESTCQVLTPKISEQDRAIVASISPLTFVCSCGDTKIYKDANAFEKFGRGKKCKCGGKYVQLQFIQFCRCGFAEPLKIIPCKQHGFDAIKRTDSRWNFICDICKKPLGMRRKCENNCATAADVWPPKVATDNSHFCPFTLSLIDLLDKGADEFIDNEKDFKGEKTIIAQYLGYISQEEFKEVLKKRRIVDGEGFETELETKRKELETIGVDEPTIQLILDKHRISHGKNNIRIALAKIDQVFASFDDEKIRPTVEQILEYDELITSPNQLSLAQASQDVATINDGYEKDYKSIASEFGLLNARVCSNIPIVSAAYGYTRKEREGDDVVLHGLKAESAKKNIYAVKLETEGVLFEFDRAKILRWLNDNDFLADEDMPRQWDEESLKTWFLEKVNSAEVKTFSHIDEVHKETRLVYRLIHSISHILIKQAAEICGLDKDSLSEYIMPNIPAVFIYCQNSQGFNMGAMYNIFQMYFDKWLKGAKELAKKCIFDPMCINGSFDDTNNQRACAGCLFINETSCRHFNKDLERGFICGYFDRADKRKIKGFWEE